MTTDVDCAVCGEPWNAWSIMQAEHHDSGDMTQAEAKLFRKGAGCPCCEGIAPEGVDPEGMKEAHVRQRIFRSAFDDDVDPTEVFDNDTQWCP
tara:strand:- start:211 stop:489 length:279 start_codon:yes stop_codon:yes gene_type:complete